MARTYKLHCEKCKQPVDDYRMEMMMGSKGYRRYPVHVGSCPKVRNEKRVHGARADFLIIDDRQV